MTQQKKTKKNNIKFNEFFKTLKPILILSIIINIILLSYTYYLKNNNHVYLFSGYNEYLKIDSGSLSTSYDINYLIGNNIEYINSSDVKIKEIKVGYYIMNDNNLEEIISYYEKFEKNVSLKETINNLTTLNVSESSQTNEIFKIDNFNDVENNLYLMMEIKNQKGETIVSKLHLDVSKIK